MPPELAAQFMASLNRARESSEPVVMDYSLPMFDGERYYEMRMVRDERGHIVCVVRDMTDRRRAEALLGESREVLRLTADRNKDLAGRLIASQEEERRRVARELHDDLSQKLALLAIQVDQLGKEANLTRAFTDVIRDISRLSAEIASDVHGLALRLHPSKLEALGLLAALESVCHEISAQHGIAVEYSHDGVPGDVDAEVSLCLYRVTQEALHNVVKHSGARRASVRLTRDGDNLYLQIADQGAGFDTRAVEHSGLGLVSIRERANFLGGRVVIYSAPGGGTRIGVRVPLSPERRDVPGIERRRSA
jgi:signal transduction histidine kinase